MVTPVCLGIDPQTTRLGLALCELGSFRAVWAATFQINAPHMTMGYQIREAIDQVRWPLLDESESYPEREIVRVGIERGVVFNASKDYTWDCGGVYHLALDTCFERWEFRFIPVRVKQWKKDVLGNGNASKADIAEWAINAAPNGKLANEFAERQDSADAYGIAVAAAKVE